MSNKIDCFFNHIKNTELTVVVDCQYRTSQLIFLYCLTLHLSCVSFPFFLVFLSLSAEASEEITKVTFGELRRQVALFAGAMRKMGVRTGDRVVGESLLSLLIRGQGSTEI